jgi:hypothetical protein
MVHSMIGRIDPVQSTTKDCELYVPLSRPAHHSQLNLWIKNSIKMCSDELPLLEWALRENCSCSQSHSLVWGVYTTIWLYINMYIYNVMYVHCEESPQAVSIHSQLQNPDHLKFGGKLPTCNVTKGAKWKKYVYHTQLATQLKKSVWAATIASMV